MEPGIQYIIYNLIKPLSIASKLQLEKPVRILKTLSVKAAVNVAGNLKYSRKEPLHSGGQHLCKFIETKESVYITKEFNSHRTGLEHQNGRRFIVLEHQYGHRQVKTIWRELTAMEESIHTCIYLSIGLKVIVEYIDTYGQVTSVEGVRSVPTLRTKLAPLSYTGMEITQREQDALEFILSCAHLKRVLIKERNRAETIYLFSIYCLLHVPYR